MLSGCLPVLQKRSLMRFLKAAAEALEGQGPLKASLGPAAPPAAWPQLLLLLGFGL
jgi:hypothetical protein